MTQHTTSDGQSVHHFDEPRKETGYWHGHEQGEDMTKHTTSDELMAQSNGDEYLRTKLRAVLPVAIHTFEDELVNLILADRKKHELDAKASVWKEILKGDGFYMSEHGIEVAPHYAKQQIKELKAEREAL